MKRGGGCREKVAREKIALNLIQNLFIENSQFFVLVFRPK